MDDGDDGPPIPPGLNEDFRSEIEGINAFYNFGQQKEATWDFHGQFIKLSLRVALDDDGDDSNDPSSSTTSSRRKPQCVLSFEFPKTYPRHPATSFSIDNVIGLTHDSTKKLRKKCISAIHQSSAEILEVAEMCRSWLEDRAFGDAFLSLEERRRVRETRDVEEEETRLRRAAQMERERVLGRIRRLEEASVRPGPGKKDVSGSLSDLEDIESDTDSDEDGVAVTADPPKPSSISKEAHTPSTVPPPNAVDDDVEEIPDSVASTPASTSAAGHTIPQPKYHFSDFSDESDDGEDDYISSDDEYVSDSEDDGRAGRRRRDSDRNHESSKNRQYWFRSQDEDEDDEELISDDDSDDAETPKLSTARLGRPAHLSRRRKPPRGGGRGHLRGQDSDDSDDFLSPHVALLSPSQESPLVDPRLSPPDFVSGISSSQDLPQYELLLKAAQLKETREMQQLLIVHLLEKLLSVSETLDGRRVRRRPATSDGSPSRSSRRSEKLFRRKRERRLRELMVQLQKLNLVDDNVIAPKKEERERRFQDLFDEQIAKCRRMGGLGGGANDEQRVASPPPSAAEESYGVSPAIGGLGSGTLSSASSLRHPQSDHFELLWGAPVALQQRIERYIATTQRRNAGTPLPTSIYAQQRPGADDELDGEFGDESDMEEEEEEEEGANGEIEQTSRYASDFQEMRFIGRGSFGEVVSSRNRLDQRIYAIKKILFPAADQKEERLTKREVGVLAGLVHENVVRYYNCWVESYDERVVAGASLFRPSERMEFDKILFVQMEQCDKTLKHLIDDQSIYLNHRDQVWQLLRQMVNGLEYCHARGIIHRDLKPANLFVKYVGDVPSNDKAGGMGGEMVVKIGDFGLARQRLGSATHASSSSSPAADGDSRDQLPPTPITNLSASESIFRDTGLTQNIGTRTYAAPEILSDSSKSTSSYGTKSDMYSLGIIFFEMCMRFESMHERALFIGELRETGKVGSFWPREWEKEKELIERLVAHDPSDRPSARQILDSGMLPMDFSKEMVHTIFSQSDAVDDLDGMMSTSGAGRNSGVSDSDPLKGGGLLDPMDWHYRETVRSAMIRRAQVHAAARFESSSVPIVIPYSSQTRSIQSAKRDSFVRLLFEPSALAAKGVLCAGTMDICSSFARHLSRRTGGGASGMAGLPATKVLKKYNFGTTYAPSSSSKDGATICRKEVFSFDVMATFATASVAEAEVLKVTDEILRNFAPLGGAGTWVLRVNHIAIFGKLLEKCQLGRGDDEQDGPAGRSGTPHQDLLSIFRHRQRFGLSWKSVKPRLLKVLSEYQCNSLMFLVQKLIGLKKPAEVVVQLQRLLGKDCRESLSELATLFEYLELWNMCKVKTTSRVILELDPFLVPKEALVGRYDNIYFEVGIIRKEKRRARPSGRSGRGKAKQWIQVGHGGRYEGLVHAFDPLTGSHALQECGTNDDGDETVVEVVGVSLKMESVFKYTNMRPVGRNALSRPFNNAIPNCVIFSRHRRRRGLGPPSVVNRLKLAALLWKSGQFKADVVYNESVTDTNELMDTCRRFRIPFVLIPRDHVKSTSPFHDLEVDVIRLLHFGNTKRQRGLVEKTRVAVPDLIEFLAAGGKKKKMDNDDGGNANGGGGSGASSDHHHHGGSNSSSSSSSSAAGASSSKDLTAFKIRSIQFVRGCVRPKYSVQQDFQRAALRCFEKTYASSLRRNAVRIVVVPEISHRTVLQAAQAWQLGDDQDFANSVRGRGANVVRGLIEDLKAWKQEADARRFVVFYAEASNSCVMVDLRVNE